MKKLMMIAAFMVAALSANAQNEVGQITLKPMAGINLATMTDTNDGKMRVGLVAGVEGEYGVAENFSVSAGLLYSMQGVKGKDGAADLTFKFDYINIPILANYYVTKGLALKAGVQPGFKVSAKSKAEANGYSAEADIDGAEGFVLAIPMGASYEFDNFVIDARYNLGVTKAFKEGYDSKHSVFSITLGYKFAL